MTTDDRPRTTSVVICTFNGGRWIEDQLLSILHQVPRPDEILLFDDGSIDDTVGTARKLLSSAAVPWRIVVNDHRKGVTLNFENGLSRASSEIIFLSDQDDVWRPGKVAAALGSLADPRTIGVISDGDQIDANGKNLGRTLLDSVHFQGRLRRTWYRSDGGPFEALLNRNLVWGSTMAIKPELLELALPIPVGAAHDQWLGLVAAASSGLALIERPLIEYRVHGGNVAGLDPESFIRRVRRRLQRSWRRTGEIALFSALAARLGDAGPHFAGAADLATERAEWARLRDALPDAPLSRAALVLGAIPSGRYWRFNGGVRSIGFDLLGHRTGPGLPSSADQGT